MTYAVSVLVALGLLVYSVLGIMTTPEQDVRRLPRPAWLLVVFLLPVVGPLAWLLAGRPVGGTGPHPGNRLPGRGAPGRSGPPSRPSAPDDDEAFLRSLRQRAEEQRRRAERERRGESGPGPVSPA